MRSAHGDTARRRFLVSLSLGILAGGIAAALGVGLDSALVGWDVLAATFCLWAWGIIWRLDPAATAEHAARDDPTSDLADAVILAATGASVVAVGAVLFRTSRISGTTAPEVIVALASIFLSWLLVHTVFTLKYARLYYTGVDGGIDFNEEDPPQYSDFAYVAFTIGMTFQVSDTNISDKQIRRVALCHALIAFPLVTSILAAAINVVAGLAR